MIVTAFRRFDGGNNGNIALTWADFEGRPGFTKGKYYRHRQRAVASGILLAATQGGLGKTGRMPDLFAIADCWLPDSASPKNDTLRMSQNVHPYIDKQARGVEGSKEGVARKRRNEQSRAA